MAKIELENWIPMPPTMGPPLPRSMGITWPWYKPAVPPEELPPNTIAVAIKNPPNEATMWSLVLTDWDKTIPIHSSEETPSGISITETATFEIEGVKFPLRIVSLQITKWNEARTALIQLYYIQSFRPYQWDFDKMDWGDIPDPDYREAFIPGFGSYFYNVATERFEE